MMLPRLFIGSAVESLRFAYALQQNLDHDARVVVWPQGVFELSSYPLEDLASTARECDFAAFVFSPDDLTKLRGEDFRTVRDNVIFEFGLFVGALDRSRTFIVMPRGVDRMHLPSDLFGLKPATYDSARSDEPLAALGPASNEIREQMRKIGSYPDPLFGRFGALTAFHDNFRNVNWHSLLTTASTNLDIVVYYFDSWVNANYEALLDFFRKEGTRMRVFMSDPKDISLLRWIQELFPEYSETIILEKIEHTGDRFAQALNQVGGSLDRLEIYYVPHLLNYSVVCADSRFMVLSIFEMFRKKRIDSPAAIIDLQQSEHMTGFWKKELEGLLSQAKRIRYKAPP